MDALTNATTGFLVGHAAADVTAGAISVSAPTEPSMTIADTSVALVTGNISTQSAAVISEAVTKFGSFITSYFPDNSTTYAAAEAYLQDAITNTTTGIVPSAIKDAILSDSRDQVLNEANRAEADLYESQSAKHRFPTGAAAGQARRIAQEALRAIAATSRTIAIKDFELSHQTALEAVRMAFPAVPLHYPQRSSISLVSSLGDGLLAFSRHPLPTLPKSRSYPQRIRLTPPRVGEAERKLKEVQADKSLTLDADKTNQIKDLTEVEYQLKAFIQDAHLPHKKLVGMLNNLRAGSSATYSVSA